jgi:phosphatidylserine synthase
MNLAHQRRRLFLAMGITAGALIVAMIAIVASFAFHAPWGLWLFAAAILAGFASHGWLMVGVLRERPAP